VFVALVIHGVMRIAVLPCATFPALQYFPTLSHKRSLFSRGGGEVTEYKRCVLNSLERLSETFLSLRRLERDVVINVHRPACKVPVILVGVQ
jgi:hypothetical protein